MPTIVIGIGNPVLTDDSVGILAVREIAAARPGLPAREIYGGGLRLMEAMAGFDRAVLIDSILTEGGHPGTVYRMHLDDVTEPRNTHSTHDASLSVALEFGRLAGLEVPEKVDIWAIEAGDVQSFGERLTPSVAEALPRVVKGVLEEIV